VEGLLFSSATVGNEAVKLFCAAGLGVFSRCDTCSWEIAADSVAGGLTAESAFFSFPSLASRIDSSMDSMLS
jgi:hypothetical protein